MQWYYIKGDQQFGPVDDSELSRLAHAGELTPSDMVWNPTMGEKWALASTVANLFPPPPRTAPPAISAAPGSTHNRDLMRMARESLQDHWGLAVGAAVLYTVLIGVTGAFPCVGPLVCLIIGGPMTVGLCLLFLTLARKSGAHIGQLFGGFKCFGTALGTYLLVLLFTFLWSLLLIIPGIIASYAYSMAFFIIADDPSVGPLDAIRRSKAMMRGNKWKLFCLFWRFFWWALLCMLTCGIGYLWLIPYTHTSIARFYDDVRPKV